jgi:hypothetical protein
MRKSDSCVRIILIITVLILLPLILPFAGCGNEGPMYQEEYIEEAISIYQELNQVGDLNGKISDEINLHYEDPSQVSFSEACERISELCGSAQSVYEKCLAEMESIVPPPEASEINQYLISFYEDVIPILQEADEGFLYAGKVMDISDYVTKEASKIAEEDRASLASEELAEYYGEVISHIDTNVEALGRITPPPIAEEFHQTLASSLEEAKDIVAQMKEEAASGEKAAIETLEEELLGVTEDFVDFVYEKNFITKLFNNLDYMDERIGEAGEKIEGFCWGLGQVEAERIIERSIDEMTKVTGFYARSENRYENEEDLTTGIVSTSEIYVSLPGKRHIIYSTKAPPSDDQRDIVAEEWYLNGEKFIRLEDGEIKKVEDNLSSDFIELDLLKNLSDPHIFSSEVIDGQGCTEVIGKISEDPQNPEKGYHWVRIFIDDEEYLTRKIVFETSPIRTQDGQNDELYREWSETYYKDYNSEFEITAPTLTY